MHMFRGNGYNMCTTRLKNKHFAFLCTCINGWFGINVRSDSISVNRSCGRVNMSSVQWSAVTVRKRNLASSGFRTLDPWPEVGSTKISVMRMLWCSYGTGQQEGAINYMGKGRNLYSLEYIPLVIIFFLIQTHPFANAISVCLSGFDFAVRLSPAIA